MAQRLVYVGAALCAFTGAVASAQEVALSFTAEQAAMGRTAYNEHCAICHGANFERRPARPAAQGRRVHAQVRRHAVARALRRRRARRCRRRIPARCPPRPTRRSSRSSSSKRHRRRRRAAADGSATARSDADAGRRLQLHGVLALHAAARRGRGRLRSTTSRRHRRLDRRAAGRRWLGWRRTWDAHGFSPLRRSTSATSRTCGSRGAGRCRQDRTKACRWCTMACSSCRPRRPRAGARRANRRSALGIPHSSRKACRRQARHGAYGDRLYIGTSDAHVIALDVKTGKSSGIRRSATSAGARRRGRRRARRTRQSHGRHDRHRRRRQDSAARRSSGSTPTRARSRGASTPSRSPASPAATAGTASRSTKRSGASVWTTGSYDPTTGLAFFGTGNTYDTGPLLPPNAAGRHERRALHELDAGHQSRHRQARLALPASPERPVGSRLGVRAADRGSARGRRDAPRRADRRQDRHLRRRRGARLAIRLLHRSRA